MSGSVIEKVRKLRALAESANVHEAAAAAAAAERLIQEHNLSEAALHVDNEDEPVTYEGVAEMGPTIATWQSNLLHYLQRAYQCCGFYKPVWTGKRSHRFVAYGRPQDLDTLKYQFAFFTAEITRLCAAAAKGKGRTFANSFRLGAAQAIGDALYEARKVARTTATSTALVVVDRRAELSKNRRDHDVPDLKSSRPSSYRVDGDGFAAGKRAGANINQRSQIGASGTRLLGGVR